MSLFYTLPFNWPLFFGVSILVFYWLRRHDGEDK